VLHGYQFEACAVAIHRNQIIRFHFEDVKAGWQVGAGCGIKFLVPGLDPEDQAKGLFAG
jgi:hypothetical protein